MPKTTLVASLTAFVLLALAPGERSLAVASERSAAVEAAVADEAPDLAVRLSGFRSDDGKVMVALFRGSDGFPTNPDKAFRSAITKIRGKRASVDFADLPPGEYAVSVIHDENDNDKLDTNFLGIPKEGIGTSNNAKARFGPPKFRDAKFTVRDADVTQRITMAYL
ncbi:MAG: DUF2141 domain-containing protein [Myxococcales bacterium]|nr:DUF2141 domain-containing protein [Myxococcales bacterium]